jgi:hypothetical protein
MREVAVAFPPDRVSAEVIASKLRAEGIPCRVDIGLAQTWEVPAMGGQGHRPCRRPRPHASQEGPWAPRPEPGGQQTPKGTLMSPDFRVAPTPQSAGARVTNRRRGALFQVRLED